ncbi:MAG: glucose-1-phosphate thymidylyltransferase [Actinomycetota bacterium]|nr:glucose-1-phosphate thymidylyltransferase [Actinomycetota bacterium]
MSTLKGLILAGGTGSRLRPITHTSAKQLVPIANRPILFYALDSLVDAGVKDVGIIVGDTRAEVMAAIGDGSSFGLNVTYIPQDQPLGLAHCVKIAREFLGDDPFVMYLGDNLIKDGIVEFADSFRNRDSDTVAEILLARVADPHRFGVAVLDESGHVIDLVEKPKVPPSDLALVGVYFFDKTIHEAVDAIKPSARGELEITDAIAYLITNGKKVSSRETLGYWKDLGQPEALLEGNRLMLENIVTTIRGSVDAESIIEGRVVIEEGAAVVNSKLRGPLVVGSNAKVIDSYIGPFTAVGANCSVISTEVSNSILLEGSLIEGIDRVEGSIVGKNAQLKRRQSLPKSTRVVVGDNSTVEIY